MKAGIFASSEDTQACALARALEALSPGSVVRFDLDSPDRATMGAGAATWAGVDLSQLDIAFLCGFTYEDPVVPAGDLDLDWTVWRYDYIALRQRYTFLHSLFMELERRGVPVVNSPDVHMRVFEKPALLDRLRRSGLNVPPFLCTNVAAEVNAFRAARAGKPASDSTPATPHLVWRPATGRAAWQLFTDRQRDALVSLRKPPVLVAELVEGPLVRAYLYRGEPVLLLEQAAPDCEGEEQLESFWEVLCAPPATATAATAPAPAAGGAESESRLPTAVAADLKRVADVLGAPWLEVLFAFRDGRAWIYDVYSDPRADSLPTAHREKLTALLAAKLLGVAPDRAGAAAPKERLSRPTLFLRRMLRILFEFERSKYAK